MNAFSLHQPLAVPGTLRNARNARSNLTNFLIRRLFDQSLMSSTAELYVSSVVNQTSLLSLI